MENNTYSPNVGYNAEHAANAATDSASEPANASTITVAEILSRIDSIISDTSYITQFYDAWKSASDNNESVLGVQQTIIARETTNQRIIAFLERMYDDVKPASNAESPSVTAFRQFVDALIPLDLDTDELMDKLLGNHTTSGALEYFFGKNSVFADNRSAAPSPRTRPNNVEFHIHGGDAHGDPNGNAPKPPRGNRYGKGAPGFGNAPGNVFSKHIQNIVGETLRNAGLNAQFDDDEDDDN
ncbi:MAG: hypothetical protein LBC65_03185 [Oscillospiraceae bacterium]|nr:hypothetical protein [Oscillospiraceae bacterium]